MQPIISIYPENYQALVKRSLVLYREGFKKVILFSALMSLIVFIPRFAETFLGQPLTNATQFTFSQLWMVLIEMLSLTFFIGIVWHMHCVQLNKHEPLMEDIGVGLKKVLTVFIASIIQGLIFVGIIIGVLTIQVVLAQHQDWFFKNPLGLFLIASIFIAQFFVIVYVASLFIFLVPIIAIENRGIFSALNRSILLVWNHWWRTVSVQMLPWLTYFLVLMFIRYLLQIDISIYFIAAGASSIWISLLHFVLFAVFIPWVAALLVVQLHDLELRNKMAP